MARKIALRYRHYLFACIMSASTAFIVSGIIIYLHAVTLEHFTLKWFKAFLTAWPIVFVAILIVAPLVNKLLDRIVEKS